MFKKKKSNPKKGIRIVDLLKERLYNLYDYFSGKHSRANDEGSEPKVIKKGADMLIYANPRENAFKPFELFVAKHPKYVGVIDWYMYMYHDQHGNHYYKHQITRNYIVFNKTGKKIRGDIIGRHERFGNG